MTHIRILALLLTVAGLSSGQPKAPPVETHTVRTVAFSPDRSRLAVAVATPGGGGVVLVWDVTGRKHVARSEATSAYPNALFTPDGKAVALCDRKPVVALLDPATLKKIGEFGPFPVELIQVVPGARGQWVAFATDGNFYLWDETAKKVVREVKTGKTPSGWAVSPGGRWLFVGGEPGDRVWDLTTGIRIDKFPAHVGSFSRGVFLDDDHLLIGSNLGTHRVMEVPTGDELLRFRNQGGTYGLVYSPTAGMMAGRFYTGGAALTPFALRPPTEAKGEAARVAALLKDCDAEDYAVREKATDALVQIGIGAESLLRRAMTDGPSAEVRMRARIAREQILNEPKHRLAGHSEEVRAMAFSPDGKRFATGGADGLVIVWDPATGKEIARFSTADGK